MVTVGTHAIAVLNVYLCMNLLLAAAAAVVAVVRLVNAILPQPLSCRHVLRFGRGLALGALLVPWFVLGHHDNGPAALRAQVWSASSMRLETTLTRGSARLELPFAPAGGSLALGVAGAFVVAAIGAGFLMVLWQLLRDARAIGGVLQRAHSLRHIGGVRVLVSEVTRVPFASWIPGRAFIVVPAELLLVPAYLTLAIRHEAQHHRQGDTRSIYLLQVARAMFSLNPAAHWLVRQLLEVQEFACDEALARRRSHCQDAYCACLLQVAEASMALPSAGLRSCMSLGSARVLGRRIAAAHRPAPRHLRAPAAIVVGLVAGAPLLGLVPVFGTPIHDLRFSRAQADRLVSDTPINPEFPLEVNDAVLAQLNLLLGTPDGRAFLRAGMARMKQYQAPVRTQLWRYGLPQELLAIPLLESGYRSIPAGGNRERGAGLWQLVATAARHYGLEVSAHQDQRLDVQAETAAALRMLAELRDAFGDWRLALVAYNAGASRVAQGITATGSRDAWALGRGAFGNDPEYLPRAMAVAVILAHPELVD